MKKFRWILLSGLLVATTQIAQAQPGSRDVPQPAPTQPSSSGSFGGSSEFGSAGSGSADTGGITNTTTTTTTSGVSPDGSVAGNGGFVAPDDAASGGDTSSIPNTGGEPMIAVLAGLSIAGAAVAMRRKVAA